MTIRHLGVLVDDVRGIHELAIDLTGERSLRQAGADVGGDVRRP